MQEKKTCDLASKAFWESSNGWGHRKIVRGAGLLKVDGEQVKLPTKMTEKSYPCLNERGNIYKECALLDKYMNGVRGKGSKWIKLDDSSVSAGEERVILETRNNPAGVEIDRSAVLSLKSTGGKTAGKKVILEERDKSGNFHVVKRIDCTAGSNEEASCDFLLYSAGSLSSFDRVSTFDWAKEDCIGGWVRREDKDAGWLNVINPSKGSIFRLLDNFRELLGDREKDIRFIVSRETGEYIGYSLRKVNDKGDLNDDIYSEINSMKIEEHSPPNLFSISSNNKAYWGTKIITKLSTEYYSHLDSDGKNRTIELRFRKTGDSSGKYWSAMIDCKKEDRLEVCMSVDSKWNNRIKNVNYIELYKAIGLLKEGGTYNGSRIVSANVYKNPKNYGDYDERLIGCDGNNKHVCKEMSGIQIGDVGLNGVVDVSCEEHGGGFCTDFKNALQAEKQGKDKAASDIKMVRIRFGGEVFPLDCDSHKDTCLWFDPSFDYRVRKPASIMLIKYISSRIGMDSLNKLLDGGKAHLDCSKDVCSSFSLSIEGDSSAAKSIRKGLNELKITQVDGKDGFIHIDSGVSDLNRYFHDAFKYCAVKNGTATGNTLNLTIGGIDGSLVLDGMGDCRWMLEVINPSGKYMPKHTTSIAAPVVTLATTTTPKHTSTLAQNIDGAKSIPVEDQTSKIVDMDVSIEKIDESTLGVVDGENNEEAMVVVEESTTIHYEGSSASRNERLIEDVSVPTTGETEPSAEWRVSMGLPDTITQGTKAEYLHPFVYVPSGIIGATIILVLVLVSIKCVQSNSGRRDHERLERVIGGRDDGDFMGDHVLDGED